MRLPRDQLKPRQWWIERGAMVFTGEHEPIDVLVVEDDDIDAELAVETLAALPLIRPSRTSRLATASMRSKKGSSISFCSISTCLIAKGWRPCARSGSGTPARQSQC
jgi:hypothetical protein